MKCPSCNSEVKSFLQFYLWGHPFKTKCKSCGAKVRIDSKSRKILYLEILLGGIFALYIEAIIRLITVMGLVALLLALGVAFYPIEKYLWENGNYEIES